MLGNYRVATQLVASRLVLSSPVDASWEHSNESSCTVKRWKVPQLTAPQEGLSSVELVWLVDIDSEQNAGH
jgi:hypothetical protein